MPFPFRLSSSPPLLLALGRRGSRFLRLLSTVPHDPEKLSLMVCCAVLFSFLLLCFFSFACVVFNSPCFPPSSSSSSSGRQSHWLYLLLFLVPVYITISSILSPPRPPRVLYLSALDDARFSFSFDCEANVCSFYLRNLFTRKNLLLTLPWIRF